MHYPPGWKYATRNQNIAAKISEGDYLVAYLNQNTIGGYGRALSTVFESSEKESWINELTLDYSTRIKIDWKIVDETGWIFQESTEELTGHVNLGLAK